MKRRSRSRVLMLLWLGVGLFYAGFALTRVGNIKEPNIDVLGFRADDESLPSLENVIAKNRAQLLHVSATPPEAAPLLPDLVAHPPSDLGLIGSREDGTLRLKFTTRFSNQGEGPLEVRPEEEGEGDDRLVQVVYSADPNMPLETRSGAGRYTFEQSHGHLHIDAFAYYELWSVDEDGDLQETLVSNPKVGFCLIDAEIVDPEVTSRDTQVYWGCRSEVQGLSPGWGDVYTALLAAQDLNVSALPEGRYALVNAINHQQTLLESDFENNRAWVYLSIEAGGVRLE